jgi:hypothetical protein
MKDSPIIPAAPQATPEDIKAITLTSKDYIEGWYSADAERMRRCLHPELVKRTIMYVPQQETWLVRRPSTADMMVEFTKEGGGSDIPKNEQTYEIIIQEVFRHIASVKVISRDMMDYLHLAKLNNDWVIVNVLWELREGEVGPDF